MGRAYAASVCQSKLGNNRSWKTNPATHKNVRSKRDHAPKYTARNSVFRVGNAGDNVQQTFASGKLLAVVINRSLSAISFTGRKFEHEFAPIPNRTERTPQLEAVVGQQYRRLKFALLTGLNVQWQLQSASARVSGRAVALSGGAVRRLLSQS
jgi:hypothetical protein